MHSIVLLIISLILSSCYSLPYLGLLIDIKNIPQTDDYVIAGYGAATYHSEPIVYLDLIRDYLVAQGIEIKEDEDVFRSLDYEMESPFVYILVEYTNVTDELLVTLFQLDLRSFSIFPLAYLEPHPYQFRFHDEDFFVLYADVDPDKDMVRSTFYVVNRATMESTIMLQHNGVIYEENNWFYYEDSILHYLTYSNGQLTLIKEWEISDFKYITDITSTYVLYYMNNYTYVALSLSTFQSIPVTQQMEDEDRIFYTYVMPQLTIQGETYTLDMYREEGDILLTKENGETLQLYPLDICKPNEQFNELLSLFEKEAEELSRTILWDHEYLYFVYSTDESFFGSYTGSLPPVVFRYNIHTTELVYVGYSAYVFGNVLAVIEHI